MTRAVQHVRRMRGGAQSHMMRCDDGNYYIVKFQNNPQHTRVLVNDYFASRLAASVGLPVPAVDTVQVDAWTIEHSPELHISLASHKTPCQAGIQFGSRYVIDPLKGEVLDYLPETMVRLIRNVKSFAGALAFDKWTCNADGRQAVYTRAHREKKYTATFIDQGYCFNAKEWVFEDAPLRGAFLRNDVYIGITGWESFEPWISLIEQLPISSIAECAQGIPPEWHDHDSFGLERLIETLDRRRKKVRKLVEDFRDSSRMPFPNWKQPDRCSIPVTWRGPRRLTALGWA